MDNNTLAWIVFMVYILVFVIIAITVGKCFNIDEPAIKRLITRNKKSINYSEV
tara:strand:+ start:6146 stop:6304 length:159 start_codon:yes stop_codon:yes gene_type:complete